MTKGSNKIPRIPHDLQKIRGTWGKLDTSSLVARGIRKASDVVNKGVEGGRVANTNALQQRTHGCQNPHTLKLWRDI